MQYKFMFIDPRCGGSDNPIVPWIDTGMSITSGQRFTVLAVGRIHLYPPEFESYMPWASPNGCTSCPSIVPSDLLVPSLPAATLLGYIGPTPAACTPGFGIGSFYDQPSTSSGNIYLSVNDYCQQFDINPSGFYYEDNRGQFLAVVLIDAPDECVDGLCSEGFTYLDKRSVNPIKLRTGTKILESTDLRIATPAGEMTFTRYYNQDRLDDPQYAHMGLGWSHNHHYSLILSGTSPNRLAEIPMPSGGILRLDEVNGGDEFNAQAGSTAEMVYDSLTDEYVLTLQNKETFVFDGSAPYLFKRHTWPNGEIWTYSFDTNDRLELVEDGYGRELRFSYHTGHTGTDVFKNGQLWRVGDHTALNLDTTSPSGRYIELDYTPEKDSGIPLTTPRALLLSVTDIQNPLSDWLYDYYGQNSGENVAARLNYLTKRLSPDVDTNGDGNDDGRLTLEALSYTQYGSGDIATIVQSRGGGLLETEFEFQVDGLGLTTEKTVGKTISHYFANGVYLGPVNPQDEMQLQLIGDDYRPLGRVDGNGNETALEWSGNGKKLDKVVDAEGNETVFNYHSNDTLDYSLDTENRKTEYLYDDIDHPRQPTQIKVYDVDGTTVLRWQKFEYANGQILQEEVVDPQDGITVLQRISRTYYNAGNGNGFLHMVTQEDNQGANDITTTYSYDTAGRINKTQQSSNFGNCDISFTVYDPAGNVVASICNYEPGTDPDPTTAAEAVALYDPQIPDKNKVTTHAYDALGRRFKTTLNAGSGFAHTSLTLYDALDRVWRTITHYQPIDSSMNSYAAPGSWQWDATNQVWRDGAGGSALTIEHGLDQTQNHVADTFYNERGLARMQRDVLGNATLYGYNDAGQLIRAVQSASDPDYDNTYGVSGDPELSSYSPVSNSDKDIITHNIYDAAGNLVQTVDAQGSVTFTAYDKLNRPQKVILHAKDEATTAIFDNDPDYVAANDPRSMDYVPSADPDRDQISTTKYDALGRVVRTQQLLENRDSTAAWMTTLYGYDALGRQVKTIRSASQPNYNIAADPDLSAYVASSAADLDIISTTTYTVEGRVLAAADVNGTLTRSVYDGLGRPVRTIASYSANTEDPANWVWDATDNQWEQSDGTAIAHGSDNDENIISHTVYDADGRVLETVDVLGRVTRQVYDDLGRQVRTISNYVDNSYNDPAVWVWESGQWRDAPAGTIISRGDHYDQNIVSTTEYDDLGRVWKTFDQRYNENRMVYDTLGRRIMTIANYVAQDSNQDNEPDSEPEDWLWDAGDGRWEDGAGTAIDHGNANDLNQTSTTTYDIAGRVTTSRDNAGLETRYEYDALGRRVKTIHNYVDGVYTPAAPDEDLVSEMLYNKAGQMIATVDPRGTQTTFTYDAAGRRLSVIQAAGTPLATQNYTCYDKAGRVRRSIQNYLPLVDAEDEPILPDTYAAGVWAFNPKQHGPYQDQNLITEFIYDAASRQVQVLDPIGNTTATSYTKDGQVDTVTDAEGVETLYRYDQLRRRTRVVQGFVAQGSNDPEAWIWNDAATPDPRWEDGSSNAINHGADQDQNITVEVTYDKAGRMLSLRNPRGHVTTYTYDDLNRRLKLINALAIPLPDPWGWITKYSDLPTGGTRVEQTYPGLSSGGSYSVARDFDRLGRLSSIDYDSPTTTPSVRFSYDSAGNRQTMTEYGGTGFTNPVRETLYGYDALRRLTSVGFDTDGDSTVEETVSYEYDAGGLRTRLTLPGNLDITYVYDAKGHLVSLTDWDNQQTQMSYDQVGRHIATRRANGLRSRYSYDAASRLRKLRHSTSQRTLGHFEYQVDKRGNRTKALEVLPHPVTTSDTLLVFDDTSLIYTGSWSDSSPFKVTDSPSGSLKTLFYGSQIEFTFGTGPDHGLFDVYIGKTLYQSYDGYAATPGERSESVSLRGEGPFLFEIRNRPEHNMNATGYRLRFKQLLIPDVAYDLHTIDYTYDAISRLQQADYNSGERVYDFDYDLAGNRLQEALSGTGVTSKTTDYEYNAVNQINQMRVDGGAWTDFTYDNNGNLTDDGVNVYTWDRANRLLTAPGSTAYRYDGNGNRIEQTVSSVVTDYLLDTHPGLAVVLQQTTNSNTERFIHGPRGIHAYQNPSGDWFYPLQDGLGSVRGVADDMLAVQGMQHYTPYGTPFGTQGSLGMPFAYTGEMRDATGLQYHRARYYNPAMGGWLSLDPFEGVAGRPISLNGYIYVEGDVVNAVDPSGHCIDNMPCEALPPELWASTNCVPDNHDIGDLKDYLRHLLIIKQSSIEIVTGDSNSPECSAPFESTTPPLGPGTWAVGGNSGTITNSGIWTHDHYTGTGENFGRTPANNRQAAIWLKTWPCIIFTGSKGRAVIQGSELDIEANTADGTLLIKPFQKLTSGFIVDLRTRLGTQASDASVSLASIDRVYISYHFGPNNPSSVFFESSREMKTAMIDKHKGQFTHEGTGRPALATLIQPRFPNEDVPTSGDSGSGIFSNGRLVGVMLSAYHIDTEWSISFSPIR